MITSTKTSHEPGGRTWSEDQEVALRLWIALARCYSTVAKAVSVRLSQYGLTTPQFGILEALHHLGPLSLGELADKLLVTGGNVTYVMDRLEDQGLVMRKRSPEDQRVIDAHLTEEGRSLMEACFPEHAEFIEELMGPLGPEEREELRGLLKRLGRGIASAAP